MLQFVHALLLLELDLVIPVGLVLRRTAVSETQAVLRQKDNTIGRCLDSFGDALENAYRSPIDDVYWYKAERDVSSLIIYSPMGDQTGIYETIGWICDKNRVYLDCESEELAGVILKEWGCYPFDSTKLKELMVKDGGRNERWVKRWKEYERWLMESDK